MTPVDADLIPDGSLAPVSGTPFDFRKPRPIRLAGADGQRVWYDHNFVLRRERRDGILPASKSPMPQPGQRHIRHRHGGLDNRALPAGL